MSASVIETNRTSSMIDNYQESDTQIKAKKSHQNFNDLFNLDSVKTIII